MKGSAADKLRLNNQTVRPVSHIKSQILDEISPGTIEIPNSMCLGLAEGATGT